MLHSPHRPITVYASMNRRPTESQFQAASREFARRLRSGGRDIRVLVARNVPMDDWERSIVNVSYRIEARQSSDSTTVDIIWLNCPAKHTRSLSWRFPVSWVTMHITTAGS